MKTLGFVFLLLFAVIGFIATAYAVAVFLGRDKAGLEAQNYTDKCKKVKVGMTLKQANDIMEDFSGRESCIRTSFDNDT